MNDSTLQPLTDFLLGLLQFAINCLYNMMIELLNAIIVVVSAFVTGLLALFPGNPCGSLIASCTEVTGLVKPGVSMMAIAIQAICWLLPMAYLVNLVGCAMITVMIYFSIAPLMRWAKLIT